MPMILLPFSLILLYNVPGSLSDVEFTTKSGNQTVHHVFWPLGSSELHSLRCNSQDSSSTLKWFTPMRVGEGQEEFKDNASIGVQADLTNKSSIVLKFSKLEYVIVNDYLCIAYDTNNQPGNVTSISVLLQEQTSGFASFATVAGIAGFLAAVIAVWKLLHFNEYSTRIDL